MASSRANAPVIIAPRNTFYVGTLKGVGRNYHQTVIDTYTKVVFAKLYDRNTRSPRPEILNDRVVPFHSIRLSRLLTDRGTEFCSTRATDTTSISRSRTSITAAPRPRAHKRMESASASIALS